MRMCGNLCLRIRYPVRASGFFGSSFLFHPPKRRPEIHLLFAGYRFVNARLRISQSIIQSATGFIVIKGGGKFFPLLGRLCSGRLCISLSKCDFSGLFHTERSWQTYRFPVAFVSGRQERGDSLFPQKTPDTQTGYLRREHFL